MGLFGKSYWEVCREERKKFEEDYLEYALDNHGWLLYNINGKLELLKNREIENNPLIYEKRLVIDSFFTSCYQLGLSRKKAVKEYNKGTSLKKIFKEYKKKVKL